MHIPFACFCDNIFTFAHSANDFMEISRRLQAALSSAGWRLPDDRMEYQVNRHICESDLAVMHPFSRRPSGVAFKTLGCKIVVAGTSHADITFKRHICSSAIKSRHSLWKCPGASRKNKIKLMHKVASSSFCWSVGAWTITQRQLSQVRAVFARPAKQALRAPRLWSESEEKYHRRLNVILKQTLNDAATDRIDHYVLKRMYDYTGHLVRVLAENPRHLTGMLLQFRDAQFKEAMTGVLGHQGHAGRFAPWCWERQYHAFFHHLGERWQDRARDKEQWHNH